MAARFTPFPPVAARYGAPMGRPDTAGVVNEWQSRHDMGETPDLVASRPVFGDYDPGGAYWGGGVDPLFAVWERRKGREGVAYVRAASASAAIRKVLSGDA